MCYGEECTENHTEAGYDDVGDSEEGVFTADDGASANDDGFGAAVFGYIKIWSVG